MVLKKNLYFGRDSEGKEIRYTVRAKTKAELDRKIYEAKKEYEQNKYLRGISNGIVDRLYTEPMTKTFENRKNNYYSSRYMPYLRVYENNIDEPADWNDMNDNWRHHCRGDYFYNGQYIPSEQEIKQRYLNKLKQNYHNLSLCQSSQ